VNGPSAPAFLPGLQGEVVFFAVDFFGLGEADVEGEERGGIGEVVLLGEGVA